MRFAKVPERVLEILPVRLVGRYAWLAMNADYETGNVPARSWSEIGVLMRCSEREARRVVVELKRLGAVSGNPPISIQIDINGGTNGGTNDITPSIQTIQKQARPSILKLWADFCEGRRGKRPNVEAAPRRFAEAVRATGMGTAELREVCRLAGESYADWQGPVNFENAIDRGIEALSRGESAVESREDWLAGG